MLYGAKPAVCSKIHTNHIYTKLAESLICNAKLAIRTVTSRLLNTKLVDEEMDKNDLSTLH